MKDNTIHIVCTIDDSFKLPLSAMLASLFDTNRANKIKIHLASANLSEENVVFFEKLVKSFNQEFEFYRLDLERFKKFPVDERITYAAYYRLVVPEVISPEVKRYIYLDADIVIQKDILDLYQTPLDGNVVGAIHDIIIVRDKYYKLHDINDRYLYFNSGVLLVDIENWKNNNTTKQIRDYLIKNFDKCHFHDQDALNAILHAKRKSLSPVWNQQIGLYFLQPELLIRIYGEDNYEKALADPAMIHFNGWEKPWHYLCGHVHKKTFVKYLKTTGLKLKYKDRTIKNILKMLRYRVLGWENVSKKFFTPLAPQVSNN